MKHPSENKLVCYTGIKSRKNGKHSVNAFRRITRKLYPKTRCNEIRKRRKLTGFGVECPKNKNTNGWIDYFGAEYITPKECDSIMKNNEKIIASISRYKRRLAPKDKV